MRVPRFMVLAQLDEQHSISTCRHGIVHLSWGRVTLRFSRDEFQRLAGLLQRAADNAPPSSVGDGPFVVLSRLDEDCEVRLGVLVLLLSPAEFREFVRLAQEAAKALERLLGSQLWDREESEPPPSILEQLQRTAFSRN